ncbi:MAG: DUF1836 domain-containing protein [Clostridia bacterium]|nr:DUF1836 domain-containing protein [Clostridia bacterium]
MVTIHKLPRWDELPDFDLYMDQVLAFVAKYLPDREEKPLTSSMVNNYVKMGVMPAPVKKKYSRIHIAHLIVICIMKSALSISAICRVIENELLADSDEKFYNRFCELYDQVNATVAEATAKIAGASESTADKLKQTVLHAAMRAQAEQAQAEQALSRLFEEIKCPAEEARRESRKK